MADEPPKKPRHQMVLDETKRYPDGFPVRVDDGLAAALYASISEEPARDFSTIPEWLRDDFRAAAETAREYIAHESRFRGSS